MTDEQVISQVCDSLQLLEQLGTAEAAKLLDRVKSSGSNSPSFIFPSHDDLGSGTKTLFDKALPPQAPLTPSLDNCAVVDSWTTAEVQELGNPHDRLY